MSSKWGKAFLAAALIAVGWLGFGGANQANAHTIYRVHTIYKIKHVTHVHNRVHVVYVQHYRRIVSVTRIRPIIYVHNIYRIHVRHVAVWHTKHLHITKWLPARVYTSTTVVHVRH